MTIRRRIAYGYALVSGFAFTGISTGIVVSNHYQQRALEFRREATAERKLLSDLQVGILYNRPAKQLSPYLSDPIRFQTEGQAFLDRVAAVKILLQEQNSIHAGLASRSQTTIAYQELYDLLTEYESVVEQFHARTQAFILAVSELPETQEGVEIAEKFLLEFTQSPEFATYVEFSDQLAPFVEQVDNQEQAAEVALQRAETLRSQIIFGSLLLSMAIAIAIALYTSKEIAQPLLTVTAVARRVTEHNNFDLQVPVRGDDEVGVLAKALNQLIQQVKQLLNQLNHKNADLEEALEQLNQQQIQLVQAEKMSSLGQLVAGIAHEINNPVNFIHGNLAHVQQYAHELLNFVQLYQKHYPNPPAEIQAEAEELDLAFVQEDLPQILSSMEIGTTRIRQIVLSLRNFSRMDEAEFKDVNIHDGIDSTLMILQHRLSPKPEHPGIQIIKDYGDLPQVDCFAGRLNQVFMNVLANAIDAIEVADTERPYQEIKANPSEITIRTSVVASQWVQIVIADNGPGMTEEIQRQIFDPFFTTKPMGKGTGMGMSISYQIIAEQHNGKLECFSTPGQGTEFVIQIPIHQQYYSAEPRSFVPERQNILC